LNKFLVIIAFAVVSTIWGLNYAFVKTGLEYSPPIWFSFLRTISGLLGGLVLLLALRTKGFLTRRQEIISFFLGMFGTGIFFAFWNIGEVTVPPGVASVLVFIFPIWTLFLSIPILGDKPSPLKVGASFLGFAGVALAAGTGTINWAVDMLAIVLLVISGFAWATDNVLFKRLFKGEQLLRANVWQLAGGSVFLFIWALISEPVQEIKWTWQLGASIAWVGVLGTAVVFVIWFTLLSRYNAASFTAYTFVVVLVALVASYFIFGEKIDGLQLVGIAALVTSIYLVNKTTTKQKPRTGVLENNAKEQEQLGP
jgi:O-acetylserine/cysteine efflux transporter